MKHVAPALFLIAILFADSLQAQERSVLRLIPTEGRELTMDSEVQGALSSSDFLAPNNSYLEAWSITGQPGQSVTIDLISDDFDATLYVAGPGLTGSVYDDDSGGGCNARIAMTFLEAGEFHVVASSTASSATGTYTLRASSTPLPAPNYGCGELNPELLMALDNEDRLLSVGAPANGSFDGTSPTVMDDRPIQAWAYWGEAGQDITITMTSGDFDSYLYAYGPGLDGVQVDDDSAGELNARLTLRITETGAYMVGAAALGAGSTGSYALRVERAIGLADLEPSPIAVPGEASGFLNENDTPIDGRRAQAWTFEGTAGQNVTITLSSDDFDSYLMLMGPGIGGQMEDDDSAGELNSRISLTLPETGTFRIIAASLGAGTGAYTLRVQ